MQIPSPELEGSGLQSCVVRAGAGAGKTRRLTEEVLRLAKTHRQKTGELPRIVVTTFTRKATQELRERLMLKVLEDEPELITFINSRSHLLVSTIHGVLDVFLKRYGAHLCVDPSYAIMGSAEALKISKKALRDVFFRRPELQELLELYSFSHVSMIARKLHETRVTYPEAKAHDLESFGVVFSGHLLRVQKLLDDAAQRIRNEAAKPDWLRMAEQLSTAGEILSQCSTGIRQWPEAREELVGFVSSVQAARYANKNPPVSELTNQCSKEALKELRGLTEELFNPDSWGDYFRVFELFEQLGTEFSAEFQKAKLSRGKLEVSDLELTAMDCMRKHPETVNAFSQDWDYWLIDEYQDTSPFQVELLRSLVGGRREFIVGDPQQSIYLFRGARSEVFGLKESEVVKGGGQLDSLVRNYRSRPELLLFFNDVFSKFDPPFSQMQPNVKDGESVDSTAKVATIVVVPTAEKPIDKQDSAPDQPESIVDNPENEAELNAVVAHVQHLLKAGARYDEICILGRTNATLSEIAAQLDRFHLPTHIHAAAGFYDRREIQDALALLKFLVNPHDNFNLIELLRSPWYRVPDERLAQLTRKGSLSYWQDFISSSPNQIQSHGDFVNIRRLKTLLKDRFEKGISIAFREALIESGYVDLSHRHDVTGRREANLWKLISKLFAEERQLGFNYLKFIDHALSDLDLAQGNEEGDAVAAVEPNRINLMTIHSSKGLQFKHVLLPRLHKAPRLTRSEDFSFDEDLKRWAIKVPMGESADLTMSLAQQFWLERYRDSELREHTRVLYVAMTRAAESLFLSWQSPPERYSWAEHLGWLAQYGQHQTANYTFEVLAETALPAEPSQQVAVAVEPRALWKALTPSQSPAVSVTQLLDHLAFTGTGPSPRQRGFSAERVKVASEGSAVHRLMELLKYPSSHQLDLLVKKWFPSREAQVLAAVEYVRALKQPPLLEIIKDGFVEWGFAMEVDGRIIDGQVDLWGRANGVPWIIDYKTGNPVYVDKAFQQMSLYSLALRKSGEVEDGEPIHMAAVFPFIAKTVVRGAPELDSVLREFQL